ncbi:PREDICTED: very-long-chain (3R)-3-hydroxyacyl-CoA dehydratase 1 [Nicrophorus vespilloides]|uniref:Very-long-chain (3R)-3-hydroxyacyl-CoA dehydratase n=1 Tax=Nicrophorus vespilloides TaxID=110193 RepID=A0ABM1MU94_NICVS|nr:PREDICTED: very-long-chain (3R)-3-hydroxyacyl-CoA dehydratase 1 [Nicrophorus vespilloides]
MEKNNRKPATKKAKTSGPLAKAYLIFYNFAQTIGWSYLMYQVIDYYMDSDVNKVSLYEKVKWTVIFFQNAALLEVVHAVIGIVSSSPMITIQQVASRVIVVCGVLMATELPRKSIGFPLLLFAWSITEIIRYSNYALNLMNSVPHFLVWLRYSTFIILYPIGVTGELLCLYSAQQEVGDTGLWTISMPNTYNVIFNYRYFLIAVMSLYIPLFPQMYLHMVSQRKKVLGKAKKMN